MKAVVCEAFGGPEVLALREVPDPPPPGPGELQVRIQARGVQYVDVLMLAGKYQFRPEPPFIPGSEGAGEVVAVGAGVTGFKPGDRVMSRHRLGAFAQLGNSKAEDCDLIPSAMSLEEAAVFRNVYHTAYHALLQRGRLKAGDWVLIHGAAGGIGLPAIQIAKLYRRQCHRDRQHRGKARRLPRRGRRPCDRLPGRLPRQGHGADRRPRRRHHL